MLEGSKYFSNVSNVLDSIKKLKSTFPEIEEGVSQFEESPMANAFKISNNNEKLFINMLKCLAGVIDTQNDILKYIISHDNKSIIDNSPNELSPGMYFIYEPLSTIVVIKEILNESIVKVHLISKGIDKTVNTKTLKKYE